MKHNVPRGVPRTVHDVELQFPHRDLVTVVEPAVRFEGLGFHVPARTIVVELGDPEPVLFLRTLDRHAHLLRENARHATMIEMPVGDEDLLQRHTGLLQRLPQLRKVPAWIDESAAHGLGAPYQ